MSQSIAGRAPAVGSHACKLGALGAFALAAALLASGPASADEVCISQASSDALSQCGAGLPRPTTAKKPEVSIKGLPPPKPPRSNAAPPRSPDPVPGQGPRDGRRAGAAARGYQLLITEIQGLETLFQSTPRGAGDRPPLLRRLAESYVELEAASFRSRTEIGVKIDTAQRKSPAEAKKLTEERDKVDKVLRSSRQAAIRYYDKLQADHPDFCQSPNAADPAKSTGCVDEVLYYLAYEHEQAAELDKARKVYLQLIQKKPSSRYVAGAYLAFGELYFNEAQGDPTKWPLASQAYSEVVKYPLPDNKVFGYAHYKLGYVYWNQSDFGKALTSFKKAIEVGQQYPSLPNASSLAVAARRDLVALYALSGQAKKAYDFFHPLSGDTGIANTGTFGMMDDLGHAYLDTGHYKDGIELYEDLVTRDRGPKQCLYQGHITEAVLADKSGNKDDIVAALDKQASAFKKQASQSPSAELKTACTNTTAELLAETAMAWHLEAVGSGGVRGTGDKKTMQLAAQLYDTVLQTFDKAQFATLELPKILKEDWPTRQKIAYLRGDLLYVQKDWAQCGPAFDAVVAEDPTGPDAAPSAYTAVLCYHKTYLEQHKGGSDRAGTGRMPGGAAEPPGAAKKLAPRELTPPQKSMLGAFDRYLCYIQPPAATAEKEEREQYIDIKFARARMYFEAQHWEEAGMAFREIALGHADNEAALPAAQLYLESMNILASTLEPGRPACLDEMAKDAPKFVQSFCTGGKEKGNAADCVVLTRVARDLERRPQEKLTERARKMTGAAAMKAHEQAADAYIALWKKYGEAACKDKTAGCERSEEILYNAAQSYQAARLLAKAIGVRKLLLDPQYNLQRTEPARKAVYEIGANYQAIASYDDAATYYERFAAENPTLPKAPEALQDAIVLRLGLGQEKQAMANAELFTKSYGAQKPALAARVSFAIGAHHAEKGDWANARKRLADAMANIDRHAPLDVQVQAHALLGRAYDKLRNVSQAQVELTKVRAAWSNPEAAMKKLADAYPDEAERTRATGKTLTAVGEALFFFAEQKRADVDEIRFPEYKGSGEQADVMRHVKSRVLDWVKKKRAAIDEADKEYRKIATLTPAPPPQWTVAGAARAGQMWSRFVAEFRAAPIPKEWKQNGPHPTIPDLTWEEIRMRYYEELDRVSEPQKQQAKAAYEVCLKMSVTHQHFDENARGCEVWLSRHYGNEYHLIDELRGSPSRVASGPGDKTQPVDLGGGFAKSETAAPAAEQTAPEKVAPVKAAPVKAAPVEAVPPRK